MEGTMLSNVAWANRGVPRSQLGSEPTRLAKPHGGISTNFGEFSQNPLKSGTFLIARCLIKESEPGMMDKAP